MGHSIQEYLKKINSRLSFSDTASLAVTAIFLILSALYFSWHFTSRQSPVMYRTEAAAANRGTPGERPFGSRSDTTYTYSWCQGSDRIKAENRVYFTSEEEAKDSGRTLSKLCAK